MMGNGILVDWHVATQLGLPANDMQSFLSGIEAMRRPYASESTDAAYAIKGLAQLERWTQVYILTDVCRELRKRGAMEGITKEIQHDIVLPILKSTEGKLHRLLSKAFDSFIQGDPTQSVMADTTRAINAFLEQDARIVLAQPKATDYLDLEEQDLSALLLSMALVLAEEDAETVSDTISKDETNSIKELCVRALGGHFGRWCLLVSVDLGIIVPDLMTKADLRAGLKSAARRGLTLQPDLIWREIKLAFDLSSGSSSEDRSLVLEHLFEELVTLRHWRSLSEPLFGETGQIKDLSKKQRGEIRKSLVFWQEAIWHAMAGIDPVETAKRLRKLWIPRILTLKSKAKISLPISKNELFPTITLYWELGNQYDRQPHKTELVSGNLDEEADFWISHSPWPKVSESPPARASKGADIIACAAAASFEARLVQMLARSQVKPSVWRNFAAHILYFFHEFRRYRYVNESTERIPDIEARNVFILVHTCRASAQRVASGRMSRPAPDEFVTLFESATESGWIEAAALSNVEVDLGLEAIINQKVLAGCVRLVEHGMSALGDGGRRRWVALLSRLSDHPSAERLDEDEALLLKLFLRFLSDGPSMQVEDQSGLPRVADSVLQSLDEERRFIGARHRSLFLVPTDDSKLWQQYDVIQRVRNFDGNGALILTWACQRFVSSVTDTSTPLPLKDQWRVFFRDCLDRVIEESSLDRFLRLRFTELLRSGLLATEKDIAYKLLSRLIEFGTAQDLTNLIDWIVKEPLETEYQLDIRRMLIHGLAAFRFRLSNTEFETSAIIADTGGRSDFRERLELVDRLVAACLVPDLRDEVQASLDLLEWGRNNRDQLFQKLSQNPKRIEPFFTDRWGKPRTTSSSWFRQNRALALAADPNTKLFSVLDPLESAFIRDLFSGRPVEPDSKQYFLGVLEDILETDVAVIRLDNEDAHRVQVRRSSLPTDASVGRLLAVRCASPELDGQWRVLEVYDLHELQLTGLYIPARVELTEHTVGMLPVHIDGARNEIDWKFKTDNFLALHGSERLEEDYQILVSEVGKANGRHGRPRRMHSPIERNFIDLLLDYPQVSSGQKSLTLCLRNVKLSEEGALHSIVVEALPLQVFSLRISRDFTISAGEQLESTLQALSDAGSDISGLFVTARIVRTSNGPQLDLEKETSSLSPVPNYPHELSKPFDERNIRWRELFHTNAEEFDPESEARTLLQGRTISKNGKVVEAAIPNELKIAGFPEFVTVEAAAQSGRPPDGTGRIVDVWLENDTWNPHTASAEGIYAEANELRLGRDRDEDVRKILDLRQGSTIKLMNFGRRIDGQGFVLAFTTENLRIRVQAESLSMLPIDPNRVQESAGVRGRLAQLHGKNIWKRQNTVPDVSLQELPAWVRERRRTIGLLTRIPTPSTNDQNSELSCEIAWKKGSEIVWGRLLVRNLSAFRYPLWQGTRVIVEVGDGTTDIGFETPDLVAEALWEREPEIDDQYNLDEIFIGSARFENELHDFFELRGGSLFSTKSTNSNDFRPDLQNQVVTDVSNASRWGPNWRGESTQRCVVKFGDTDAKLCGLRTNGDRPGRAHFLGSELLVRSFSTNDEVPEHLTIRRRFKLRPVQQRARQEGAPRASQFGIKQKIKEGRAQKVSEWLSMETTLDGRFHQERGAFQLRDQSLNKYFSEGIAVTPEAAKLRRSPSPYHNKSARAVIVADEPVTASCVETRPLSLEDLMDALEAEMGELVKIDPELLEVYLVGIRNSEPSGEMTAAKYVFEWGYGFWVSVSASKLRFKGQDIELSDLQLFVEDQVSAVRFEMHHGELTMSIEDTIPCQAHVLFEQANKHQIIHPLHVRLSRTNDVQITFVEGFDPTAHGDPRRPMGRRGSISGHVPQLDDAGVEAVQSRAQRSKPSVTRRWQGVIMARLDVDAFRQSYGEELRFQYVRLDQEFKPEAQGIRDGDRIFARLGRIFPLTNDFAIEVRPYSGIHHSDIHPDFADSIVLRRSFSFRQQTLARLYRESPERLVDHYVLVRVGLGKRLFLSIRDGAPFRQSSVLESLLSKGEKNVFAIYAGTVGGDRRSVQLEMRPGVVVSLRSTEAVISDELVRGDVVRVSRTSNSLREKYVIERALYSDMRYTRERRPIVALPMQNLAKPDSQPPYKNESARTRAANSFSIGSLPDVQGKLRTHNSKGELILPNERQIENFMSLDHPKIAWLEGSEIRKAGFSESNILIDSNQDIAAARLEFSDPKVCTNIQNAEAPKVDNAHLLVRFIPLQKANSRIGGLRTDWYMLTFRDASARRLLETFHEARWRYHDQMTIVWRRSKNGSPEQKVIEEASLWTGPLFIEERAGSAILRYSIGDLSKHAIGFSNLFEGWSAGETIDCVVAGLPSEGGLYVEVVPGRIVELPPSMLVLRGGQNDKINLDDLDWGVFAPGDELTLQRLKETDSFSPERVLIGWKQSIRNAFGPVGAALSKIDQNLDSGSADFGVANFQISLPSTAPQKLPELALIGGLSIFEKIRTNDAPPKSSTVVLSKQDNGKITINGFESWQAIPDKEWNWEKDALMNSVMMRRNDGTVLTDWPRMDQRVQLGGGSIPVTVEFSFRREGSKSGVIYFSRRHQELSIAEGKFALTSVLGQIPGTNWIVLKCGGRQTALPAFQLVTGLPESLLDRVIEKLRSTETPIWIHKSGGNHYFGISAIEKSRLLVRPELVVSDKDGKVRGFVCAGLHDRRLHWLSVERASVAPLTEETASATFLRNGRFLEVITRPDGSVSFVDHPRVQRELSSMELGRKLGVEIINDDNSLHKIWDDLDFDRDQLKTCLVRSRSTGLILSAAVSGKRKGHVLEVAERKLDRKATYVFLLPSTKRRLRYCFPKSLAEVVHLGNEVTRKEKVLLSPSGQCSTLGKFNLPLVYNELGKMDEFPFQYKELIEFYRAYVRSENVSLLAGISGAVILDSCGEAEDSVLLGLLRNIGYRCMQSFHMEVLGQWFTDRQMARSKESVGTRARIDDVLSLVLKTGGNTQSTKASINRIYDHLALNGSTAYERALADAIAVGFGQIDKLDDLVSHKGFLENLTDTLQAVRSLILLSKPSDKVVRKSVSELDVIGKRLVNMETDVILNNAITFERRRSK